MAEQSNFPVQRGSTLTWSDNTGTPKTFSMNVGGGTFSWTKAAFDTVRAMDQNGDYVGPARKGAQTAPVKLSFAKVRVFDPGANASEAVASDLVLGTGYVASTWTSQVPLSEFDHWDLAVFLLDTPAGTAGSTWTFSDVMITEGSQTVEVTPEGVFMSFDAECAANPTVAAVP